MSKVTVHSRRMFLRGACGAALAIPFLPSLVSPGAAKAGPTPTPKRFVQLCTHHGGIWAPNMFPSDAVLTEKRAYGGHEIRRGDLRRELRAGRATLVEGAAGDLEQAVLSADPAALTDRIASKMNVIRGLDITFYIGHHTGGHLGNYARNDGNGGDGKAMQEKPRQTLDQLMAWSPSFYPDLGSIKERSMIVGSRVSYGWSDPASRSGTIQEVSGAGSSKALFDRIFVPPDDGGPKRPPIVDRVLASYKSLRSSDRRLSSADRTRLDEHVQRLSELSRKLATTASCGSVTPPTKDSSSLRGGDYSVNPAEQAEHWSLFADVIVAAFVCGTSRIAVLNVPETFSDFKGDWHQDVAHKCALAVQQKTLAAAHQRFFERVFLDLVNKLDVDDGTGASMLEDTLVAWTQESCNYTHDGQSIPIVTAGSAGASFRTGSYCDYRNLAKKVNVAENPAEPKFIGHTFESWFSTVLRGMGLTTAEIEAAGYGKNGVTFNTTQWMPFEEGEIYPASVFGVMGDPLPWLLAT